MNLLLAQLIPFFAGFGLVYHQTVYSRFSAMERFALAFPVGQILLTLTIFLTNAIFGNINILLINTLLIVMGLGSLVAGLPDRNIMPEERSGTDCAPPRTSFSHTAIHIALIVLVAVLLGLVFLTAVTTPILSYDGFAIYAPRSFAIYQESCISHELLQHKLPHPDYPLLIPIGEAWTALMIDDWNEHAVKIIFPFYLTSLIFLTVGFLNRHYGPVAAWSAAALLLLTPKIASAGYSAVCDFPVGVFILAGVVTLLELRPGNQRGQILLPAILLAGASWTKNEGLPLALIVLCVFSTWHPERRTWVSRLRPGSCDILRLLVFGACVVPWWIQKTILGLGSDMINARTLRLEWLLDHIDRVPTLLRYFSSEMLYSGWQGCSAGQWLSGWVMFWLALILFFCSQRQMQTTRLALVVLLQLLLFFVVFTITPYELVYQLRTALDRMLLQLFPTAMLFTFMVFFTSLQSTET